MREIIMRSWDLEDFVCDKLTVPDTAGMSPDPAGNNTDMRSSEPNQASRTPDFSGPLVSSISFSSSSPICLFLVHNSTIIARTHTYVIPLYRSMTSSWVNTECTKHGVQHTTKIVCRPFVLSISI